MQDKPLLKVHNYDHKVFNSIASILENVNNLVLRFREKWSRAREREDSKRSKENAKEERKRSKEVDMMMLFEEEAVQPAEENENEDELVVVEGESD